MPSTAAFNAGVPAFGTWILYAFLVAAACSFALAIIAGTADRATAPRFLRAARFAALGTCALIALDVLLLAYAFVSHDFRVRYVMRYSDRSMPAQYLFAALWGGQDGSLLWWTFLLSGYTSACILWLRNRHRELAPYIIATLMGVIMFFGVLMAFAANPFGANVAGAPPDGEGLNPSLQNFYMAIHPPSLYTGFVGCSVPFAFVVAALITGRLDDEWIKAVRRWALFAWLFLSVGNTLGMLWAYEELGWGGFWAWDPVENAAAMPWFTVTAFLHSAMIQERRDSLKVWNVSLVLLSFVLTIFGTFLTRSGLISSIHSFAQSEVGIYFLYFLGFLVLFCIGLVVWRLPKLSKETEIDSVLSREAMFVVNNWLLLGICMFIVIATTWPKVSEWLWKERLTVGASFYNFWLPIPGLTLLATVAIGTLTPWRKASEQLLWKAFRGPLAFGLLAAIVHVVFGGMVRRPAVVHIDPIYPSMVGRTVAWIDGHLPAVFTAMVALNVAAVVQEFYRGTQARQRSKKESGLVAFGQVVSRNRRRYGGYIVHVGISLMFLGWAGQYWHSETEALLAPGESTVLGDYRVRYDGFENRRDPNKRMVIANVSIFRNGRFMTDAHPAKFIYATHPDMPTSEVSITPRLWEDVYVVMSSVNAQTHIAHLKVFVNPFTVWIWLGCLVLMIGCALSFWPEVSIEWNARTASAPDSPDGPLPPRAVGAARAKQGAMLIALLGLAAALLAYAGNANAQGHTMSQPPPVGGASEQMSPEEHRLFDRLLCMCGDCQRLPLATCTCDFAAATRANMRAQLARGVSADDIVSRYASRWGAAALSVPPDAGHNRMVYLAPIAAALGGAAVAWRIVRSWRGRAVASAKKTTNVRETATQKAEYDKRLDEELRGLDD